MFLNQFHSFAAGIVQITAHQASRFAKEVAGDYNPIHDPDAKRFCVPGDLLFALVLMNYGLSERMAFRFRGMVGDGVKLRFPAEVDGAFSISDTAGKLLLDVERSGAVTHDPEVIEAFIRRYVAFSGHNFPHVLQPLMQAQAVMFNPDRPLVIYDSMDFELHSMDAPDQPMELQDAVLDVKGKRGEALLHFKLVSGKTAIGIGSKKLVISGLRDYDEERMQDVITEFYQRRDSYSRADAVKVV